MHDRRLLYVGAFLRALATGMAGVLIGIYLARLDFDAAAIGMVVAAGLGGAAAAALLVTVAGDRIGRRRALRGLAVVGALGGAVVAVSSRVDVMIAAACVGMLNGMGRDRGAAVILDQAVLPTTTTDRQRTQSFAWYNLLQDAGHALGALLAGLPELLQRLPIQVDERLSLRLGFVTYATLLLLAALVYAGLSPATEAPVTAVRTPVSPATRRVLWRISALFAVDSLGGGFLTTSLLSFFFFERFGATAGTVGLLFFGARVANGASHLAAAWLARRFGLVNTMVFTHIPSSLFLVTVGFAPSFSIAAALFLLREGLVEMDVPTRQSYVMAVVRPEERVLASGVTHLVRLGGWALAPAFAGLLMKGGSLATPLFVGAAMKISYDLLLYAAFRRHVPPEEAVAPPPA